MVLIGSSARYQDDDGYRGGFTRDDLIGLYRLMMTDYQTWLTQFTSLVTGKPEGNVLRVYLMHLLNSLGPDRALAMARTVLESDIREWLPLVSHPTLLLQARADPIVPHAAAEYLHRSLAGSQLQVLPADGHFAFLDVPDVVAAAIREFAAT